MKRIYVVGLCLLAAVAFAAVTAGSASAAPEYGQCKLLTKGSVPKVKHGKYGDATCTKLSEKKGKVNEKGSYEWYPGPSAACVAQKKGEWEAGCTTPGSKPHKGHFEREACYPNCAKIGASGGAAVLEGESGLKIECASNSAEGGEILSATTADGRGVYTGCKIASVGACTSGGAASGEIKTEELIGSPVEIAGLVWIQYTAKTLPYLAQFECGGVATIKVTGSADGIDSGNVNVMSTTSTQEFSKTLGNQALKTHAKIGAGSETEEGSFQNQTSTFTINDTNGAEIRH